MGHRPLVFIEIGPLYLRPAYTLLYADLYCRSSLVTLLHCDLVLSTVMLVWECCFHFSTYICTGYIFLAGLPLAPSQVSP